MSERRFDTYATRPRRIKHIDHTRVYPEKVVDTAFKKTIEEAGGLTFKNHPMTNKGIPDRVCHYHSRTFYVEMKTTGEPCTEIQIAFHAMLKEKNIETYVLDTKIDNINDLWLYGYTTYKGKHYHKNPHKPQEINVVENPYG